MSKNLIVATILIIMGIGLGFYGLFVEPNMLIFNRYVVLDNELKGLKVVFASDFHIKSYQQKRLEKVVNKINSENPDIVLSVGDFISGHNEKMTMSIEDISKELAKIKSKYGFYTTLGNHDGWYGKNRVQKALFSNGIRVLANENVPIKINEKTMYIAGMEDLTTGSPDVRRSLSGAKEPTILLTHNPDVFFDVPLSVNLTLAGHTHGGQIRLPFAGAIFTGSKYNDRYALGFIEENGKKLITTKGIGTSILPVRFNCVPEIVVIEFK